MPIDDELEKSSVAAEIQEESEQTVQNILVKSGMAGALSLIPFGVGSTINQMLTELAFRRTNERMKRMFDQMAGHIRELGQEKIDREWFRGEEFQSLLFEAIHQLHVTENEEKIRMLGNALANSGATEFKDESRKEIFLRLIRELAPQHIKLLRQLFPHRPADSNSENYLDLSLWRNRPQVRGLGDGLLTFQMLAANGLVEEHLKREEQGMFDRFAAQPGPTGELSMYLKQLEKLPLRYFALSELGRDFLKFVGAKADVALTQSDVSAAADAKS
jgi:hypothetical protein